VGKITLERLCETDYALKRSEQLVRNARLQHLKQLVLLLHSHKSSVVGLIQESGNSVLTPVQNHGAQYQGEVLGWLVAAQCHLKFDLTVVIALRVVLSQ